MIEKRVDDIKISVVIPTLNGETHIARLIEMLNRQTRIPDEILIVDSDSDDETREVAAAAGAAVYRINRSEFDHGGTRDMALRRSAGDIVVFMTQDALPVDERFMENLIRPLADEQVAMVGGRQTAYPDARPFEKLIRAHNYPEIDRVWSAKDIAQMGVRAFLLSDVCAAYRRAAYMAIGGFDHPIMTNEDMLIAERFLHAGYKLAYSKDAAVYHSHNLTLAQEYKRNYIVGRTMVRYAERFEHVGEMGAGAKLAKDVSLKLLAKGQVFEWLCFAADCAARLAGNRIGRYVEARQKSVKMK